MAGPAGCAAMGVAAGIASQVTLRRWDQGSENDPILRLVGLGIRRSRIPLAGLKRPLDVGRVQHPDAGERPHS